MWVYSNQLICFSDCCAQVAVTAQNEGNGLRIRRQIYTIESDNGYLDNNAGNLKWVSSDDSDFVISYNADEQGWVIGPITYMNQSRPFLMTEKDSQAFDKCPHDSSLTWFHAEDRKFYKFDGDDINVKCPGINEYYTDIPPPPSY